MTRTCIPSLSHDPDHMVNVCVSAWLTHAEQTMSDEAIEQLPDHRLPHVLFVRNYRLPHVLFGPHVLFSDYDPVGELVVSIVLSFGSEEERQGLNAQLRSFGFGVALLRVKRNRESGLWEVREEVK